MHSRAQRIHRRVYLDTSGLTVPGNPRSPGNVYNLLRRHFPMRLMMVVTLAAGSCAFAQTRGGTMFGNMINTVPPPGGRGGFEGGGRGFGGGGFNGYGGFGRPQAAHPRHENTVIVPYPVMWGPSYFGGYYDSPAPPPPPAYYPQEPGYPAYAQQAQP